MSGGGTNVGGRDQCQGEGPMSGGGTNVRGRDQCQGEGPLQRNTLSVQCCLIAFGQCDLV